MTNPSVLFTAEVLPGGRRRAAGDASNVHFILYTYCDVKLSSIKKTQYDFNDSSVL